MDALLRRRMMMLAGGSPTPPVVTPVFYNYLCFDGTAYIETTYVLPASCSLRVNLSNETSKSTQQVIGVVGSNGGAIGMVYGGGTNNTRRQILPYYDSPSYIASNRYLNWTYAGFSYFMTPNRFGWGNSAYTYTKGSLHPDKGISFGAFNLQSTMQKFTGRMTQIQIYGSEASGVTTYAALDNYTPVATFRPCTYNDVPGLWYEEGNAFFGNSAGAGTLTVSDS